MQHAFHKNRVIHNTKQNEIATEDRLTHLRSGLWMQAIDERVFTNPGHLFTKLCHKADGTAGVVFGNIGGYLFQIGLNPP